MSKKKSKSLLPKRIAGVKIPKAVRKGALGQFLQSNAGQKMMAEGLMMVGAAIAGRETAKGSGARKSMKLAGGEAASLAQAAPARLAEAFEAAMGAFRHALLEIREEVAPAPPPSEPGPARIEVEPSKKKRSSPPETLGTAH